MEIHGASHPEFASDTGNLQIPTTVGVSYDAQNQAVAPGKSVTVPLPLVMIIHLRLPAR